MQPTIRRQKSRGQAVVEFALILPVFLLLTVGVIDMARIFTAYVALTNGVANAALYAAQNGATKWCAITPDVTDVACPLPVTPPDQQALNPNNIGYQLRLEATGLNMADLVLSTPQCLLTGTATTEDCTQTGTTIYSQVQISATYRVSLFTPLVSVIVGQFVNMSASTTAAVQ
jgi:uncharacterized protein (UPF0333 family)